MKHSPLWLDSIIATTALPFLFVFADNTCRGISPISALWESIELLSDGPPFARFVQTLKYSEYEIWIPLALISFPFIYIPTFFQKTKKHTIFTPFLWYVLLILGMIYLSTKGSFN